MDRSALVVVTAARLHGSNAKKTRRSEGLTIVKAIVQARYGGPDVLEFQDIDAPAIRDDEVLVRVHAAAVHPGDVFMMEGVPYVMRLAFGHRRPRKVVPGLDVAGTVEAVGAKVKGLAPGDEVLTTLI